MFPCVAVFFIPFPHEVVGITLVGSLIHHVLLVRLNDVRHTVFLTVPGRGLTGIKLSQLLALWRRAIHFRIVYLRSVEKQPVRQLDTLGVTAGVPTHERVRPLGIRLYVEPE